MFGWSEEKLEPTAQNLKRLCRDYGIQNEQDALFQEEFTLGNDLRVDVMTIDLQKFVIRGFEVKVSRSDFVGDGKWQAYLHNFNFFYFVTPPGLIKPSELPPEIFLLEFSHEERDKRWGGDVKHQFRPTLKIVKRGKKLQQKFVRETYGEHFFHRILLSYIRNLRWRNGRLGKLCPGCGDKMHESELSA